MSDLYYLDYFNGMSSITNPNSVRLYKSNNGGSSGQYVKSGLSTDNHFNTGKTYLKKISDDDTGTEVASDSGIFIASCPFNEGLKLSASNTYDNSSAGLVGELLERFAEGAQKGSMFMGSAMQLGSQVTSLIDKFAGTDLNSFVRGNEYQQTMKDLLSNGQLRVEMPWKNTKIFHATDLSVDIPQISLFVMSSESLKQCLIDNKVINNTDKPVKAYINYLINELAGTVATNGNGVNQRMLYQSPTNDSTVTKMQKIFDEGGYDLSEVEKGQLWMAIGNYDVSECIYIYNLIPTKLAINTSPVLTTDFDYLWAKIDITVDMSRTLVSSFFKGYLNV